MTTADVTKRHNMVHSNNTWTKHYMGAVVADMRLTAYEAELAYRGCRWHMLLPKSFLPGVVGLDMIVHQEQNSEKWKDE